MKYTTYSEQARNNLVCLQEDIEYHDRKEMFCQLAKRFTEKNIHWALGCSMNLFCRGIVDDFHDLDLIVDIRSVNKIKKEMEDMGAILLQTGGNGFCESDVYLHYQLGRVDVDIISGFRLITFNTTYYYKYDSDEIDWTGVMELNIPLISMEALYVLYYMMEGWQPRRKFKRVLIEEYFAECKISHPEVLQKAITENSLPGQIKLAVKELLKNEE